MVGGVVLSLGSGGGNILYRADNEVRRKRTAGQLQCTVPIRLFPRLVSGFCAKDNRIRKSATCCP